MCTTFQMTSGPIAVFGAGTLVGQSVAKALSKQYDVQAVVAQGSSTDPTLTSLGVKVVEVDLNSRASVTASLAGVTRVFVQTTSDNARQEGYDNEVRSRDCLLGLHNRRHRSNAGCRDRAILL